RVLAPVDGYRHYLPLHVLAARMLRAGHLPVWNPYTFSGYPLLAANQAAVLYPPNWAFVVLPAVAANNAVVIVDFVVAGVGAFLLYAAVLALTASKARWRPLVLASALLAVGGGLAAVQLLPTAAILHATDRAKLDYASATTYSLPASHTPLLVFPYLFGGRSP